MKNFKILLSVAASAALVACSSMSIDENEALAENFPKDFTDAGYIQVHPELVRIQVKDYVTTYNANASAAAKAAGSATFATDSATDAANFAALDVETLQAILLDPQLGGYTAEDWAEDWTDKTKDTTIVETKVDTLSLTVKDSVDKDMKQTVIIALKVKAGGECVAVKKAKICDTTKAVGSIEYDAAGKITALHGFSSCDSTSCPEANAVNVTLEPTNFLMKVSKTDTMTIVTSVENKKLDIKGGISADHWKVLNALNFCDASNDLEKLKAIPLDTFAISYQYVMYGRAHGWAYRPCTEAEKANPVITETYPVTKLYCDDAGVAREIQ
jgi:hypothetical protein